MNQYIDEMVSQYLLSADHSIERKSKQQDFAIEKVAEGQFVFERFQALGMRVVDDGVGVIV